MLPSRTVLLTVLHVSALATVGSFSCQSQVLGRRWMLPSTRSLLSPYHYSHRFCRKSFIAPFPCSDSQQRISVRAGSRDIDAVKEGVSFFPLPDIVRNKVDIEQAIAREDYQQAARLRDENQKMVSGDDFTRLQQELSEALLVEDYKRAAQLQQELLESLRARSSNPVKLDRIACLTREGQIFVVSPDGAERVSLADSSDSKTRYTMPVWSPSGDMVASIAFTGTALNSKVDSKQTLTVFQSRDGNSCFALSLSFSPYCLQWSKTGTNICYITRTHRKQSEIVSVDIFPRPREKELTRAKASGDRMKRSSDNMMQRSLCDGELLFFSHQLFPAEFPSDVLVHSGIDRQVFLLPTDPQLPRDPLVLSNNSGLFGTPQFHPLSDLVLFAEEVAPLSQPPRAKGSEEEEEGKNRLISQSFPRPVARDSFGVVGQLNSAWQRMQSAGQQQLVLASRRGRRKVLERLDASSSSFSFSPDGNSLAILERSAGKEKLSVLKFVWAGDLEETRCEDEVVISRVDEDGEQRREAAGRRRGADGEEEDEFDGEQERVIAFFWSPDSSKLLYLTARASDVKLYHKMQGMALRCRWNVFSIADGVCRTFPAFSPSTLFLDEVFPKFDLFANSFSLWSPDSNAFCYAGRMSILTSPGIAEVHEGAWVQDLEKTVPVLIHPTATFAAWSPC
ncbi:hypothetical protein GUITHDRAFT_143157 [Guillardia theta CCMP2712]|uniref:UVR domain-containing protein n=2 Tax=Guillardia theta TaxID=55529 RepID=L1IVU2_GUITC|nr:hypothetical protein GUITHDRAFT_143157 [Guillardia theta CCMP2712]EKX40009.1 hypothetical protein GUITHDRAFT_143157 [Guillardia theta CCMP2712]|eukprot:XP_005826989.1 hypothetical protein GUITHDRAFT_143157 [Guillardia theta CCMP2712]